MAICQVCGKGTRFGRKISHAGNRVNRARKPNLQRVRAVHGGRRVMMTVCTSCLKAGKVVKAG
ncbi:MAG: 50S ribosomal protein L28 [Candidatus Fraserbacteria bacterium RBG_16_55_9]|uniref:Large ribosomal subunit protein bL28 n=1 Tax=Fraserbacteria sp. (strain RBG_16_55_9) TaxID=1817864 RepID=A0A1F5V1V3_FRAXR|nr:MAG: 50S ribosomal protein L28 [Candidatus Fraserbacteria bacterium RBG_16_55_9]